MDVEGPVLCTLPGKYGSDDEESPTWALEFSFSELLKHFITFMQLPSRSQERNQSPFYF
jgi:hypothetical protein